VTSKITSASGVNQSNELIELSKLRGMVTLCDQEEASIFYGVANGSQWEGFDIKARYWNGKGEHELMKASVMTTDYVDLTTEEDDDKQDNNLHISQRSRVDIAKSMKVEE
jgi:hypothetical protein